jgi:DinB superfamily
MNSVLDQLQREIASSLHGLDATQTQLRPLSAPEKWSIQQIVEHLLLTYSGAEMALNARLAKRRPTAAKPSALQQIRQFTVHRLGYFPGGRQAPDIVTPAAGTSPLSGEELATAGRDHLSRFDLLCTEAEQLFGSKRCASHNVLGPLSVDQWRRFQLVHGRHHLKQIAAIRKANNL